MSSLPVARRFTVGEDAAILPLTLEGRASMPLQAADLLPRRPTG